MKLTQQIVLWGAIALVGSRASAIAQQTAVTNIAVGSQYDTTHVYVAPSDVDAFVKCFLSAFGGKSTPQVVATVTPTPSKTTSQLLQTPVGTVSLFGFQTPIPAPFGAERNGYLVTDMTSAVAKARAAGADIIVAPFPDPIGIDAIVQWPGGVDLQLYWHTKAPAYTPFIHVPENRIYVSEDRADQFVTAFLQFSSGRVVEDDRKHPGDEVGRAGTQLRRVRIESTFGKMLIYVTDGHMPYPYGTENTGYEVDDLSATLSKAESSGAQILVQPKIFKDRHSAMLKFPGGYVAEVHELANSR